MIDFSDLKVDVVENDGNKGIFKIGPLPKGYGNTLANALRRILLSSLEGSGVTSVKIANVDHEYTTVDGVKETVMDILLNLKEIRFKCESDEPQTVKVSVKGEGNVTAGDLDLTESVSVMDPKAVIATVTGKDAKFEMEMTVEKGIGYRLGDEGVRSEVGRLPLDTKFSPIKRVMYNVEETRKGGKMDLDMITISIFSDGSLDPKDSLAKASNILMDLAEKTMVLSGGVSESIIGKDVEDEEKDDSEVESESADMLIEDTDMSTRTKSALVGDGIAKVADLLNKSEDELMDVKGFGDKAMDEVATFLDDNKLSLKK
jgi:DNA-directed RNA polymerase subunit alpha